MAKRSRRLPACVVNLIDDQIDDSIAKRCGHIDLDGIVMELMRRPEDVDLVQRPMHPVVDKLHQQQRDDPGGQTIGQGHQTIIVVEPIEERHDHTQQHNTDSDKYQPSAHIDDNVADAREAFVLDEANSLLDQHEQTKDGEDLGGKNI